MGRKKSIITLLAGILTGTMLAGPAAQAATQYYQAQLSKQTIYVDGKQIAMTVYSIGGSNYVKLRDIGKAVDFDVSYDATTDTVQIDSDAPYVAESRPAQATKAVNPDGSINIPQSDAKLALKEGDVIRCDDGTNYTIKDMSHNREDPGALPAATCDWTQFPAVDLPRAEARHFVNEYGEDYLFIRNLYETRRMQYTLYNAIGQNSQTWRNGKPVLRSDGSPMARVQLSIPSGTEYQTFWPWGSERLVDVFHSCPPGLYQMEAWDVYVDGRFLRTEYDFAVK